MLTNKYWCCNYFVQFSSTKIQIP